MSIFDFYLMCDNIDSNWTIDIRKSGKQMHKESFFNLPRPCLGKEIEYFKLNEETKNCVIYLKA